MRILQHRTFTINDDLSINVEDEVNLDGRQLKSIPLKIVYGDFSCKDNQLTSLEGCPDIVCGSFHCNNNQLTSLVGGPQK
jgi:hypothetical protein